MKNILLICFVSALGICQAQKKTRFSFGDESFVTGSVCEFKNDLKHLIDPEFSEPDFYEENRIFFDSIFLFLKEHPELKIEVGVYTASHGTEAENLRLSQQSADRIRDVLIWMGIPSEQLSSVGYGESSPAVPDEKMNYLDKKEKENAQAMNRRIELKIVSVNNTDK